MEPETVEPKIDPYHFDGALFEPDEARRYWTIVATVNRLGTEDEMRLLVEAPVLMAKVTLRHVAQMVAEIEEKKQAIDVQAASIKEALKKFEELIESRNQLEADLNWDLRSKNFSHAIIHEVKDVVDAQMKIFLAACEKLVQVEVAKYLASIDK